MPKSKSRNKKPQAPTEGERARSEASRLILEEDAKWLIHCGRVMGEGRDPELGMIIPQHFARIIYEGKNLVTSKDAKFKDVSKSIQLKSELNPKTAIMRQLTKLTDDKKKPYEQLLKDMESAYRVHQESMSGRVPLSLQSYLVKDIGILYIGDKLVTTSVTAAYRLDVEPTEEAGPILFQVAQEWGQAAKILSGEKDPLKNPLLSSDRFKPVIKHKDYKSKDYLGERFDKKLSMGMKLFLLGIEGDLNFNASYIDLLSGGYPESVFRAKVVTLHHSLKMLHTLKGKYFSEHGVHLSELEDLMRGEGIQTLLSQEGAAVRNRCMHYAIGDKAINPVPGAEFFGIVEQVYPGMTYPKYKALIEKSNEEVAYFLAQWRA